MNTSFYTPIALREAVVQKLKAASIDFVRNAVYKSRTENGWPEEGVFICVYTTNSDYDDGKTSPTLYTVSTSLNVDIVVASQILDEMGNPIDLNDLLDLVTARVVAALCGYPHEKELVPGVMVDGITLRSVTNTLQGAGEVDKGAQKLAFNVVWTVGLPVNDGTAGFDYRVANTVLRAGDAQMNFETNVQGEV